MGIFKRLFRKDDQHDSPSARRKRSARHQCHFEALEERRMLASNIHLGAVYFDPTVGDDSVANTIQVSFEGGDAGTELKQIIIDGDKLGDGQLTLGDVFFDTAPGGMGAFLSAPVQIQASQNFTVTNVSVADGGMKLIIDLEGFTAGDVLTFTVDVDEMGLFNPNSLAEGAEFEGSKLTGKFEAPHYLDAQGSGVFYDAFDTNFASAAAANGSTLKLPKDNYAPPGTVDQSDHTAGAVASIIQVPKPVSIAGTVYEDANLNNDQNGVEPGIGGVKLELFKLQNGSYVSTGKTTTTNAQGQYKFEGPDLLPGTYRVVETQPTGYFSVGAQPGTIGGSTVGQADTPNILSQITVLGGQDSIENNFGEARPASLSGVVYHDRNNNGVQNPGDEGIGGVTIQVIPVSTIDGSTTPIITTTNADGSWSVTGLAPGTYRVVELQPAGYIDGIDTPGNAGGTAVNPGDQINGIVLAPGQAGINYKFGEYKPGSISGRVHGDLNGDCTYQEGEKLLAGVKVHLLDKDGKIIATTTTNALGEYRFDNLVAGTYGVLEETPVGYFDGGEKVGSAGGEVTGNDRVEKIVLVSETHGVRYDFCEKLPSSISGRVHGDLNGDCTYQEGELLLAGVKVHLLDKDGKIIATTTTNALGEYKFDNLAPGTYGVLEETPVGYFDGGEKVGSVGGAVTGNDKVEQIVLISDTHGVHYDFCEKLPSSISGRVHGDLNGDCTYQEGELLLSGVKVHLLDKDGNIIATTTTNSLGEYKFDNLAPGTYGVLEETPAGYFDGGEKVGSVGGAVTGNDKVEQIILISNTHGVHYDFCEKLPSSISGRVHGDLNGDCTYQPGERLLEGVKVHLLDKDGKIIATTTTNSLGEYKFNNLAPGTYGVLEETPAGYFDGGEKVGNAGGSVTGNDRIEGVVLTSGTAGVRYDFCEKLPSSISGRVHGDLNGDCTYQPGELLLSGVKVHLLDKDGNIIATTTTNSLGEYKFDNLAPGTYGVLEETPVGYFDGGEKVGSEGGAVTGNDRVEGVILISDTHGVHYDFCEKLPASISGRVHADTDGDCELDPGEKPIAGVTIRLLNANGQQIATTLTNAQGEYKFENLAPGTYSVVEDQPSGYFDGGQDAGSAGGVESNDRVDEIVLGSGVQGVNYNFCEKPPAMISGYVFQDGDAIASGNNLPPADVSTVRDGVRTSDDIPIKGVVLQLRDGVTGEVITGDSAAVLPGYYSSGPITAVTDENGHYEFKGLKAGNYAVFEVQPANYFDAIDTPGTTGGVALNPHAPVDPSITAPLVVNPHNDALLRIQVTAGQHSQENNFSEVTVRPFFDPPPPPELPPPPPVFNQPPLIPPTNPVRLEPYLLFENPPDINGSAPVVWYTWHLSVTNAGQPRAVTESGIAMLYTSPLIPVSVTDTALDGATWSLYGEDGTAQQFVFGAANGRPVAGDFNGDGKSEMGVYIDGQWFIDLNGNGVWDAGDLWAKLGSEKDRPVVGDWDGDGKDDIGIYGPAWAGDPRAIRAEPGIPDPYNEPKDRAKNPPPKVEEATLGKRDLKIGEKGKLRSDLIDHVFNYGTPKDVPVVGDWNGDGIRTIGVFRDGTWYLDVNGDGRYDENDDRTIQFGQAGDIPVVGDWNGKSKDQVGVFRGGKWLLDSNGNGSLDASDKVFELGGADDLPVVGDWNGDGTDKPAAYHRGTTTQLSARP
ncbi:MAG: carboxypeptidase regulatory-like domain-containing protein [Planctomycetia bacterium]|nr:carboxypeptidase regulatory-like domain-containing protein [Planctomycetia bacterium]